MSAIPDPAILELARHGFQNAIRRLAVRHLEAPGPFEVRRMRQVERLMRIAVALTGTGSHLAYVEVHGIPSRPGDALPELLSVSLTDLLAARVVDQLPAALQGDAEALLAIEREAERVLETEDIQLG